MVDKPQAADSNPTAEDATPPSAAGAAAAPGAPPPPRRPPGHRATDSRDTVAEMAARAQEISQEAGSKIAQAMKDVIGAAAGIAVFAVESARDLVQYMVRRGQMTQEEADRLIREAEEAHARRKPPAGAATTRAPAPAAARPAPLRPAAPKSVPTTKAPAQPKKVATKKSPSPRKKSPAAKAPTKKKK